jgi:lysozyme family protein
MADFNIAYKISFKNEGGWVNDPNDTGGETYRGISRVYNPTWKGWAYIDSLKPSGAIKKNWTNATADKMAGDFYKATHWDKIKLDKAINQENANQIYDHALSGLPRAIEKVKAVLKRKFKKQVVENTTMSDADIEALNSVDQGQFFDEYKKIRTDFFKYSAAQLNPKDSVYGDIFLKYNKKPKASNITYLKGWLNRVGKYAYTGVQLTIDEVKKNP